MRRSILCLGLVLSLLGVTLRNAVIAEDPNPVLLSGQTAAEAPWQEQPAHPVSTHGALLFDRSARALPNGAPLNATEEKLAIALAALKEISRQFPGTPAAVKAQSAIRQIEAPEYPLSDGSHGR